MFSQETTVRLHVFVTPAMRRKIEAKAHKFGSDASEVTRRGLEYAITRMEPHDWTDNASDDPTDRIHVIVTTTMRVRIESVVSASGAKLKEVTCRAMRYALSHMKDEDWMERPDFGSLPRGPGRPRKISVASPSSLMAP